MANVRDACKVMRLEERYATIRYGNHPGAGKHSTKLNSCLNKDDRNNHSLSFPVWSFPLFQYSMVSPLSVIIKQAKKDRVIADSSFRPSLTIQTPSGTYAVSAPSTMVYDLVRTEVILGNE